MFPVVFRFAGGESNQIRLVWFRLSARGLELRILKTIPWNKVNVTVKKKYLISFYYINYFTYS